MGLLGQVGVPVLAQFSVVGPDGFNRLAGVPVEDVDTELWVDDGAGGRELSAVVVTVIELDPEVGEYAARFTPVVVGNHYLVIRHPDSQADWSQETQVYVTSLDEIAEKLDAIDVVVSADVILVVEGIDDVVAGVEYTATAVFRRKSTLALFDPEQDVDDNYVVVEVLDGDGETLLETIDGADIVRIGIGKFRFKATPAAVGINYLRLSFQLPGNPATLADVFAVHIRAAVADGAGADVDVPPVAPPRVYTYPTSLIEAGYDLTNLTARQRWRMCRDIAALIDSLTEQWFNAESGIWYFDGRGSVLLYHRNEIPFVAVSDVTVIADRTNDRDRPYPSLALPAGYGISIVPSFIDGQNLSLIPETYRVRRRCIERVFTHFPGGSENVEVDGVLGWIEGQKDLETVSVGVLNAEATELEVDDITGFAERDVVDIFNAVDAVRVILRGVDRVTSRIQFDALGPLPASIVAGATVRTFGQVPLDIENLANFLFGSVLAERQAFQVGGQPIDPARIKKESTDDYSYELFDTSNGSALLAITNNYKYAAILKRYSRPGSVRVV